MNDPMSSLNGTTEQCALVEEAVRRAHQHGERWTNQRSTVLVVLAKAESHLYVDAILERARVFDKNISQATVYRSLHLLVDLGLVAETDLGGQRRSFELRFGREHHDHLVDLESGAVLEFTDPDLEALQQIIARRLGYDLIEYRLLLFGRRSAKDV